MSQARSILKGVVHGKTIELETESGWPEGQEITILVRPTLPPGEGIRQSAGGWADAGDEFGSWLDEMQRSRLHDRPELA